MISFSACRLFDLFASACFVTVWLSYSAKLDTNKLVLIGASFEITNRDVILLLRVTSLKLRMELSGIYLPGSGDLGTPLKRGTKRPR